MNFSGEFEGNNPLTYLVFGLWPHPYQKALVLKK